MDEGESMIERRESDAVSVAASERGRVALASRGDREEEGRELDAEAVDEDLEKPRDKPEEAVDRSDAGAHEVLPSPGGRPLGVRHHQAN